METAKYETIGDKDVVGLFFQNYNDAVSRSWVPRLASTFTSNSAVEKYGGVGNAPALREWVGERLAKALREYTMTVENKPFEATLAVMRADLRRDKTAQLLPKIMGLAQRAAEHDEKLLSQFIDLGEASTTVGLAYDGQFFFDTDHVVGASGTINNDISVDISALPVGDTTGAHGSTTAPSVGEAALCIQQAIQQLFTFLDDAGEPTNQGLSSVTVMVPAPLMAPYEAALTSPLMAQGMSNPIFGSAIKKSLVVNPRLTWTTKIAVFRDDSAQKPLIVQSEEGPVMETIGEGSEHTFKTGEHLYGIRKSGNVAFWDFTKACLVTMT